MPPICLDAPCKFGHPHTFGWLLYVQMTPMFGFSCIFGCLSCLDTPHTFGGPICQNTPTHLYAPCSLVACSYFEMPHIKTPNPPRPLSRPQPPPKLLFPPRPLASPYHMQMPPRNIQMYREVWGHTDVWGAFRHMGASRHTGGIQTYKGCPNSKTMNPN